MCRAVQCRLCGKTTWSGCGMHIDAVRRGVPAGQWCAGHSSGEAASRTRRKWFGRSKGAQGNA